MLRIKIVFFLTVGVFIVGYVFAQNESLPSSLEDAGNASFYEQTDYEDMNEEGITNNKADAYEMGTEEATDEAVAEDLSQADVVEGQANGEEENKGYVYYSSSSEQKKEKERKEGISPWGLVKKLDDWIKKNLW